MCYFVFPPECTLESALKKNVVHESDDQQVNRLVSFSPPELQRDPQLLQERIGATRCPVCSGMILLDNQTFTSVVICSVLDGWRPAVCVQLVLANEVWSC